MVYRTAASELFNLNIDISLYINLHLLVYIYQFTYIGSGIVILLNSEINNNLFVLIFCSEFGKVIFYF